MSDSGERLLVLGATGTIGRRVAARLRAAGRAVTAASPSSEVRFDWADPGTWPAALAGAGAAFVMAPDGVPVEPAFLRQAADRGVRHLVLLSSRSIEVMGDERLLSAEQAVREAGARWTVVRGDWFDQNFDEGIFRDAVLAGELAVPVGDVRQGFVDAGDLAAVVVAALTGAVPPGRTWEVTGPSALSFGEVAAVISDAAGRTVRHAGDAGSFVRAMTGLGVPTAEVEGAVRAFAALAAAGDAPVTDTVERLTGRAPRSFREYAADAAARGAWAAGGPVSS